MKFAERNAAMDVRLWKFQFKSLNSRARNTKISERSRDGLHRLGEPCSQDPDDDPPPPVPGPASEEDLQLLCICLPRG